MEIPKVNKLEIDEMLEKSEITAEVLKIVFTIQKFDDYTKEDAAQELIKLLHYMGYLTEPLEIKKRGVKNEH